MNIIGSLASECPTTDLIVFYSNGQTFRFQKVTHLKVSRKGSRISFCYFGESTKVRRECHLVGIAGYAVSRE